MESKKLHIKKRDIWKTILFSILLFTFMASGTVGFADYEASLVALIDVIVNSICIVVIIIGFILAIIGMIDIVKANSEGQGAEQQRAASKLGTGVAMIVIPAILTRMNLGELIASAISDFANK